MLKSYRSQSATFSSYKHHNTAKGLVGISPNGAITFVSDLYAGIFSDRNITKDSGIYDLLEPGNSIMVDRGFTLEDNLPEGISELTFPLSMAPELTKIWVICNYLVSVLPQLVPDKETD